MQTSKRLHEGSFSALACSFLKLPFFNTTVFYRLGLDGMTTNFRVSYSKNPIKMEEGNEVLRPFADRDSRERIFEADISKKGNMYNITYFDNVVGTVSEYMRPETISRTLVKQETIDIKQGIFVGSEEETTLTLRNHIAHELDMLGPIVNRDGVPLPNPTLFEVDSNLCGQLIGRFNFVEASCYFLQRRDFGKDLIRSNLADEILYEIHAGFRGLYADTWMCSSAGDILANPEEMILQSDEIKAPDVLNNLTGKPLEEIFKENRIVELLGKTPRHEFTDELIGTVLAISGETTEVGAVAECYWRARVCGYDPAPSFTECIGSMTQSRTTKSSTSLRKIGRSLGTRSRKILSRRFPRSRRSLSLSAASCRESSRKRRSTPTITGICHPWFRRGFA